MVGPNGCGKSNILDGVSWVLGEQSAKSLRGTNMEDVIFAGTRDRKALGMAEVSLTLVDPDAYAKARSPIEPEVDESISDAPPTRLGRRRAAPPGAPPKPKRSSPTSSPARSSKAKSRRLLRKAKSAAPQEAQPKCRAVATQRVVLKIRRRKFQRTPREHGEIVITRRLFRTGESEYLLNGKLCRLRDIQDIFMGTGLGPESYAIIEQERIGQLLSSKPHDRRAIIEEAAGITRFKTKKRLAELRLESAKQNLARVDDIFEEVTRQMNSLKRQAAKAERLRRGARRTAQPPARGARQPHGADGRDQASRSTTRSPRSPTQIDASAAHVNRSMRARQHAVAERGYELDASAKEASAAPTRPPSIWNAPAHASTATRSASPNSNSRCRRRQRRTRADASRRWTASPRSASSTAASSKPPPPKPRASASRSRRCQQQAREAAEDRRARRAAT